MRILLLCSAFNSLSQRVWLGLRAAGHEVTVEFAISEAVMREAVTLVSPDLILCPFLKERVPADIWQNHRTVILHPGPVGDRGPSALDWAITDGEPEWGVTALQAVEEMDAGPVWGTRAFRLPDSPPRKSSLYNGPVADAAVELAHEVVAKASDPDFRPVPLERRTDVTGRLRPAMRQKDRAFSWTDSTARILRLVHAADGSPGVRTTLGGLEVAVFDARPGVATPGEPGTIAEVRLGALLVRTGDGAVWIGHVRVAGDPVKLPAALAIENHRAEGLELPVLPDDLVHAHDTRIEYRRFGDVGVLRFEFYNGAMSTGQCRRLAAALRHAGDQSTRVLVVRGGETFSNGLHLGVIEASPEPAHEAWQNIVAIDEVCKEIITCTRQLVVTSIGGNAGAGGVMLALGADRVLLREGVVLNPHYRTMGLFGSEYWTYVLPRRVGEAQARSLTEDCLPISAAKAARIGLVDQVLPGTHAEFEEAVLAYARRLAMESDYETLVDRKRVRRSGDERRRPLESYRIAELAEMSRDIFDDRNGFAAARHEFVTKKKALSTPDRIALHRSSGPSVAHGPLVDELAV